MNLITHPLFWSFILPLLGFLISGFLSLSKVKRMVPYIACTCMFLAALQSTILFVLYLRGQFQPFYLPIFQWIEVAQVQIYFNLYLDQLSVVMLFTVQVISFFIHLYSLGYMQDDPGVARYFTFLNLFVFAMTGLVLSDNLLLLFVFWEGVGLCSYYLIGHWFEKESASFAGMKAFIVNRIGDFGFMLGIFIILKFLGTLQITDVIQHISSIPKSWLVVCGLCLFLGATGKSAQIPLFVWLPDAMEGPTPVSALIHAATMVTAGVYMVARLFVLFAMGGVLEIILWIGVATALMAALIAKEQTDLKKILAYSTISQLGYMFAALGVGIPQGALFHLVSHAFFKALLFLGAGSVMHATHGILDIRRLGGLSKTMPVTTWTTLIGAWALSGLPPWSGFWSKDPIVEMQFATGHWATGILLLITGAITAFYSFKLVFLTFFGQARDKDLVHHTHESSALMCGVLGVLSIGALALGIYWHYFPWLTNAHFYFNSFQIHHEHEAHWVVWASIGLAIAGLLLAFEYYRRVEKGEFNTVSKFKIVLQNKFYVDELYDYLFVMPYKRLCDFCYNRMDMSIINGFYLRLVEAVGVFSKVLAPVHHGRIQGYVYWLVLGMILGLTAIIFWSYGLCCSGS